MPVEGLPKVLENTLDTLLKEYSLSSWQIRGGEIYTQVTLRFPASAITAETGTVQYRRAPPSRVKRDQFRSKYNFDSRMDPINVQTQPIDNNSPHQLESVNSNVNTATNTVDNSQPMETPSESHIADEILTNLNQSAEAYSLGTEHIACASSDSSKSSLELREPITSEKEAELV